MEFQKTLKLILYLMADVTYAEKLLKQAPVEG